MHKNLLTISLILPAFWMSAAVAQTTDMGSLCRIREAETRSISPENFTGEKGQGGMATLENGSAAHAARELGQGWKVNPYVHIEPGTTFTLAQIDGSGVINHIWMTPAGEYRLMILRFYWDGETEPSVEVPVGDFFASGWGMGKEPRISSLAVCVNPRSGFNSYWQMPFRKGCRVTMENLGNKRATVYYQIDYSLETVPDDAAYFHAQFRRVNPLPEKAVHTIVDGIRGRGHYVGAYLAHGATARDGGARAKSNFTLTATNLFRRSAARAKKTTSADPTATTSRKRTANTPTKISAVRIRVFITFRTMARNGASASTAGTSRIPSVSKKTSA